MKVYDIHYPNLEVTVRFKTLSQENVKNVYEKKESLASIEYILLVIDTCIYNLRTSVRTSMQKLSPISADQALMSLYNGCVMLNPGLDPETWKELTYSYDFFHSKEVAPMPSIASPSPVPTQEKRESTEEKKRKQKVDVSDAKFFNLAKILSTKVVGQQEAVKKVADALKRAHVGLSDPNRPLGVFLFAGPSGVGKTLLAKELQKYLFGDTDLVRVDCGEYQHKHENQKLIGSPPGFVGHDDGGQLTKAISQNQKTVLLLDEAEKAHPDFWNTFLKIFDDGYVTDSKGNNVSFKNVVIIITSNLGNDQITKSTYSRGTGFNASIENNFKSKTAPKRDYVERETLEAIHKFFKPEMINRLDEIIVFNHLQPEDYLKIAELELSSLSDKMIKNNFDIRWDEDVVLLLSERSGVSIEGARGMARVRREEIENPLADRLLNKKHPKGTIFTITVEENKFIIN